MRGLRHATVGHALAVLVAAVLVSSVVIPPATAADPEGSGPDSASAIDVGVTVTGTLDAGDEDWFAFTASEGRLVEVTVTRASNESGEVGVSAWRGDDAGGAARIDNGDTADTVDPGESETITFAAPASGTYYVEVDGDAGAYEVTVTSRQSDQFEPNDGPRDAASITVGDARTGEFHEDDEDWFEFTARRGRVVNVTAVRDASAAESYSIFAWQADDAGRAAGIDGGDTADFVRPGATGTVEFVAPATGTYYLEVDGDAGAYEVTVTSHGSDAFEPADLDGDGRYEDVDGDGSFDVVDVTVLLDELGSAAVQERPARFDFNGDARVDILDVAALLDRT